MEERVQKGWPEEWDIYMDCMMPDDGQEILITTKTGIVDKDVNEEDCSYCFLDSGYDWTEDIVAWMPLPEPY